MTEAAQLVIPSTTPVRVFKDHGTVLDVAVLPDGRMVTASDMILHLQDEDAMVEKMKGHGSRVRAVAVSPNGQLIASGDGYGKLIVWNGDTGKSLTQAMKAHSSVIRSLNFSPDRAVLAAGSRDDTTKLWSTGTWQQEGKPIKCCAEVYCVRYSPSGELLAIATEKNIQI